MPLALLEGPSSSVIGPTNVDVAILHHLALESLWLILKNGLFLVSLGLKFLTFCFFLKKTESQKAATKRNEKKITEWRAMATKESMSRRANVPGPRSGMSVHGTQASQVLGRDVDNEGSDFDNEMRGFEEDEEQEPTAPPFPDQGQGQDEKQPQTIVVDLAEAAQRQQSEIDIESALADDETHENLCARADRWYELWCGHEEGKPAVQTAGAGAEGEPEVPAGSSREDQHSQEQPHVPENEVESLRRIRFLFGAPDDGTVVADEHLEAKYTFIMFNFSGLMKRLSEAGLADPAANATATAAEPRTEGQQLLLEEGQNAEENPGNFAADSRVRYGKMLKVLENIWHGFHIVMFLGRLRLINNTRAQALLPDHLMAVRYCPPDMGNISKYQTLLLFYLAKARESSYRKVGSTIYEPVRNKQGKFTHAWRPKMEIEEFCFRAVFPREHNSEIWKCLTDRPANAKAAAMYLEKSWDSDFPFLKRDKKLLGFTNGVYDVGNNKFYLLGDPQLKPEMACANFFNVEFEEDKYNRALTLCTLSSCTAFLRRKEAQKAQTTTSTTAQTTESVNTTGTGNGQAPDDAQVRDVESLIDSLNLNALSAVDSVPPLEAPSCANPPQQADGKGDRKDEERKTEGVELTAVGGAEGEREAQGEEKAAAVQDSMYCADHDDCICENDPLKIPTPAIQSIFDYQGLSPPVCRWIYAMMGRLFFDVNERDGWQIQLFLKGVAGTGKSCLLKLAEFMFDRADVGFFNQNTEKTFPLQALVNKYIYLAMDIHAGFQLDQYIWQSMVSGEGISVARKGLPPLMVTWSSHGIFAGNGIMKWNDNGGSVSRRLMIVLFKRIVTNGDPKLFSKMKREIAAFIKKSVCSYLCMVQQYAFTDLWNVLPDELKESKSELQSQTNSLEAFVTSEDMQVHPELFIPFKVFKELFETFCSKEHRDFHNLDPDYWGLVFQKHSIKVENGIKDYNGEPALDTKWITGIDVRVPNAPPPIDGNST